MLQREKVEVYYRSICNLSIRFAEIQVQNLSRLYSGS